MAATAMDGEDRVVATAQQILKSLGPTTDLTNDMISILSTLDHRFSAIYDQTDSSSLLITATSPPDPLRHSEQIILGTTTYFDEDFHQHYLTAVDDILHLILQQQQEQEGGEENSRQHQHDEDDDDDQRTSVVVHHIHLDRAETLLQIAMSHLEDQFRHILSHNTIPLDSVADDVSPTPPPPGLLDAASVATLRQIAARMLRAGYDKECCQAYIAARRDVLDDSLSIVVGIERLSIEEVQKMEWRDLDDRMRKWAQAVNIAIQVLLSAERQLCNGIFFSNPTSALSCFTETAKGSVTLLLSFAEAVSISRPAPEKLFRLLDMYNALSSATPALHSLFSDTASGDFVRSEAQAILTALGDAVKATLAEFETAVHRETSQQVTHGGEIHPLTRYVMNYITLLVDYSGESLNSLLNCSSYHNLDGAMTPLGCRLLPLIEHLELNLAGKSKLYDDSALQCVFMMNNILYVVQKIKDSELGSLLGDQWVRKRRGQIRQLATSYLRSSWTRVLSFLRDEGLGGSGSSSSVSKMAVKDRFKKFNLEFEEIYRNQTGWKVSDLQLREELRLSVSDKVIPAYRSFVGRFGSHLEGRRNAGKYVKYSPEDIESLILDLFEGLPGSSNHPRKKISG